MKDFEADYIEKIINIMKNNELTEVTLEDNEKSVVIKTNGYTPAVKEEDKIKTVKAQDIVIEEEIAEVEEKKNLVPVVSSMIGLYYAQSEPEAKPFVKVGDKVKQGQVICLIETIKLMNKITSDVSGTVAEICIENGKPVEYGQVIMYIEQD